MTLKKQSSQITLQAQQERENFQREKNNLLIMLQKVITLFACWYCKHLILFTWKPYSDVCRRERSWRLWKENMQSYLKGRPSLIPPGLSQTWVPVTHTEWPMSLMWGPKNFYCDFSDFCDQHLQSLKERRRSSSKENSSHPSDSLPHKRSQQLLNSYGRSLGRTLPPKVVMF